MSLKMYDGFGRSEIYDVSGGAIKRTPWTFICHRGWTISGVPYNTLPALYAVRENDHDWCEIDLRLTSDGVLILSHDATITDANGDTYTIASETAETLCNLVLATTNTYGDIHPPTFDSVLEMAAIIGLKLVLDIKNGNQAACEAAATAVLQYSMQDNVVYNVQSNSANVAYVLAVDKNARFNFDRPSTGDYTSILSAVENDPDRINIAVSAADTDLENVTAEAKSTGCNLYIWNVTPTLYPASAGCYPAVVEYQSGREGAGDMKNAISEFIDSKTWW